MTQVPSQGPVIQVKPQPNVYTLMLILTIVALATAVGIVMYGLLAEPPAGYGIKFPEGLFKPLKDLIPGI